MSDINHAVPPVRHSRESGNPEPLAPEVEATSIPHDWSVKPLSEIAGYQTGRTPSRANTRYWSKGNEMQPWVSISDMKPHATIVKTAEQISRDAVKEAFRGRISKAGTLLMSFKLTIGRVATLGVDACHNEAIISIYPKHGINQKYLEYFLAQVDYTDYQDRAVKGHTLNQEKIDRISISVPPLSEQQKIAAVLWMMQRAIATQDRLIAATRDLKQSAMQQLFTHGLRGEALKDTAIGPMPESWEPVAIGEIASVGSGGTPSRANPSYWLGGTIPWVKTGEVDYCVINDTEEKITATGLQQSAAKIYPKGSLLMAMYGQGITRGKVAILGVDASINQACAAIQTRGDRADSQFLYYVLTHHYEHLRGLAHGGQQQNLNADLIRGFSFGLPADLAEQRDIATALATIDRKLAHHQQKRAALNDLFQTTLHQLMTAQIRVTDLDIDTSEVTTPSAQGVAA